MKEKKTIKETIIGTSGSILSGVGLVAGACCAGPGGAACGSVCAPAASSALTSIFGLSSSALASWTTNLLPLFMVISAIAFTSSYFKLFKGKTSKSGNSDVPVSSKLRKIKYQKSIFWVSLLLTISLYGYAFVTQNPPTSEACCTSDNPQTEINRVNSSSPSPKASCCSSSSSKGKNEKGHCVDSNATKKCSSKK